MRSLSPKLRPQCTLFFSEREHKYMGFFLFPVSVCYMHECSACMCVCVPCTGYTCGLTPTEARRGHQCPGTVVGMMVTSYTWVWRKSRCSGPLSHLSSLLSVCLDICEKWRESMPHLFSAWLWYKVAGTTSRKGGNLIKASAYLTPPWNFVSVAVSISFYLKTDEVLVSKSRHGQKTASECHSIVLSSLSLPHLSKDKFSTNRPQTCILLLYLINAKIGHVFNWKESSSVLAPTPDS